MFDRARRLPGLVLVFAAVVAASSVVLSQSQSQRRPTFRAGIDLVQIDVVVVDELGAPVRGLTAADFTLLDRGKPQQVAAFSEVSHDSVEGEAADAPLLPATLVQAVASNASARSDRIVVLVVDDLHLFRDRADTARRLARRLVHEAGSGTSMAVLLTSGEHSTQVSQESGRHLEAIDTIEGRKAIRRPHEACDSPAGRRCSLKDFFDNMHLFGTLQDAARMLAASRVSRSSTWLAVESPASSRRPSTTRAAST